MKRLPRRLLPLMWRKYENPALLVLQQTANDLTERVMEIFAPSRLKYAALSMVIIASIALTASCTKAQPSPTPTQIEPPTSTYTVEPSPTDTLEPTATQEPTPTYTPTPVPLEGRLFFDMNGSGLADEASFNYDADRLTDERQPLHEDLLAAITAYINEHPELQDGDLITLEEPGLSNYTVCAKDICATTGADGSFVLPGATQNSYLNITDPNAGIPALEMRYINKWNKAVTVPAYEMNGVQVPEQNLNDTEVLPISKTVQVGKKGEIGLMQGFRTYTLPLEAIQSLTYITGYDHDPSIGNVLSFSGDNTLCAVSPYCRPLADSETPIIKFGGIFDSHPAYDYFFTFDNDIFYIFAGMPGVFDTWDCNGLCASETSTITGLGEVVGVHGHIYKSLLSNEKNVFRGQIIALTGENEYKQENPNYNPVQRPHYESGLRYGPFNPVEPDDYVTSNYKDIYAVIDSSVPMNYPDLEKYSSWTVFNLPVYP